MPIIMICWPSLVCGQCILTIDSNDLTAFSDIRTLSLLFILSFVSPSSTTYVKVAFLEQHRDLFISIFRGLNSDPYVVARKVLEVCWMGIWQDLKVKRTLKVGLFNEATLQQVSIPHERLPLRILTRHC